MLHVHRQISGLKKFSPVVITQKREGNWAAARVEVVPRSPFRFAGRGIERWFGVPWQITQGEAAGMNAVIRESGSMLLHIFFGNVAVRMLPLIENVPVPVVISFHGSDVTGEIATPAFARIRHRMFERARLVLCRSEQLATRVAGLGCDPAKLRIMRTVLPPVEFHSRSAPADGAWRLVQASRLIPKKGLATALKAFAIFQAAYPLAKFTIAGEGPLESELRELAASLGISESVEFRGFLPQDALSRLYAESHIFLQPSETVGGDVEGIPNALLEAMASGLPSVGTDHGGIPEVIRDGTTGLLCQEGDSPALAAALRQLATDPGLYEGIARDGANLVRSEFSADRQIANVERLYSEASDNT